MTEYFSKSDRKLILKKMNNPKKPKQGKMNFFTEVWDKVSGTPADEDDTVTFAYKDYADGNKQKEMTLDGREFVRRFEQHILPKGFTKIRTYSYLGNRDRHKRINEVLRKMKLPLHKGLVKIPLQLRMMERYGMDINQCSCCKQPTLQLLKIYYPWKQADDG